MRTQYCVKEYRRHGKGQVSASFMELKNKTLQETKSYEFKLKWLREEDESELLPYELALLQIPYSSRITVSFEYESIRFTRKNSRGYYFK